MRSVAVMALAAIVALVAVGTALNDALRDAPPITVALSTVTIALPTAIAVPVPTTGPLSGAEAIIEVARAWLNPPVPYLWGGCTRRGVDCSCFVRNVLAVFGINAPRTTSEQIRWAIPITRDQIAPTDLVFFNNTCVNCGPNPTHVGMAIGNGLMIHCADPCQVSRIDSLQFAGAGRPR